MTTYSACIPVDAFAHAVSIFTKAPWTSDFNPEKDCSTFYTQFKCGKCVADQLSWLHCCKWHSRLARQQVGSTRQITQLRISVLSQNQVQNATTSLTYLQVQISKGIAS